MAEVRSYLCIAPRIPSHQPLEPTQLLRTDLFVLVGLFGFGLLIFTLDSTTVADGLLSTLYIVILADLAEKWTRNGIVKLIGRGAI